MAGDARDELAGTFDAPHVRAALTGGPADRIAVRDYTRAVDIGAFAAERGRAQRVRFNVVLEVCHSTAGRDDDVDKVLSYDMIVGAIERALAAGRVDLLETLAERVAAGCLADPRALRAFVRVEKLDRGPFALGVEIVRARRGGLSAIGPAPAAPVPAAPPAPVVVALGRAALGGPSAAAWRDAVAGLPRPCLLVAEPAAPQPPARGEAALRIGLLAMEQAAWAFAGDDPRFAVAASRTEIDHALRTGGNAVWAPLKLVIDAVERPACDASDPLALAAWLASLVAARRLVVVGAEAGPALPGDALRLSTDDPARLAAIDL